MRKEESKFATIFLISVVIILFGVLIFIGNKDGIKSIRGNVVSIVFTGVYDAFDGTSLDSVKWEEIKPTGAVIQVGTPASIVTDKGSLLNLGATDVDSSSGYKEIGLNSKFKLKGDFEIVLDVYPGSDLSGSNIQFGVSTNKFLAKINYSGLTNERFILSEVTNLASNRAKVGGFTEGCSSEILLSCNAYTSQENILGSFLSGNIFAKAISSNSIYNSIYFNTPEWMDRSDVWHNAWIDNLAFDFIHGDINANNFNVLTGNKKLIGIFNYPTYIKKLKLIVGEVPPPSCMGGKFQFCWDKKIDKLIEGPFKLKISRITSSGLTSIKIERKGSADTSWTIIDEVSEGNTNLYTTGVIDNILFDDDASVFIKISKKQGSPAGNLKAYFNDFIVNNLNGGNIVYATGTYPQYRKCAYNGQDDILVEGHACNDDTQDNAGCTDNTYAVFGGKCYKSATTSRQYDYNDTELGFVDVDADGDKVVGAYNENGVWWDCDYSESKCTSLCNYRWLNGGEKSPVVTTFGEYELTSLSGGVFECCGDDAGEYAITTGSNSACCNTKTDCVDSGGVCRGGVENSPTLCIDGIDNDCDGLIDSKVGNSDPDCQLCVSKLNGHICSANQICPTTGQLLTASDTNYCCSVDCVIGTNLCTDNEGNSFAEGRCLDGYKCEKVNEILVAVPKCSVCSCPSGETCQIDGTCITTQVCSDGITPYGKCSTTNRPNYCSETGAWISDCRGPDGIRDTIGDNCDCPYHYEMCQEDGSCKIIPLTCSAAGGFECTVLQTCPRENLIAGFTNPTSTGGLCCDDINKCTAITNGCKDSTGTTIIAAVGACDLSVSGPLRYCNVVDGTLIEKCTQCGGCPSGKTCQSDETKQYFDKCVDASTMCNGCIHPTLNTCVTFEDLAIIGGKMTDSGKDWYCDITKNWVEAKATGVSCSNDYECKSNVCIGGDIGGGKCTSFEEESAILTALKSLVCSLIPIQKPAFCTA